MRAKMTMQIVDFRGMKYTLAKMIKTYHEKKVEEKKNIRKNGKAIPAEVWKEGQAREYKRLVTTQGHDVAGKRNRSTQTATKETANVK